MADETDNTRALAQQIKAREKAERMLEQRTAELLESNTALSATIEELESKRLAMVQQEKLASIGLLAAGIAHEINNPIGFVKSNLDVLKDYFHSIQQALAAYKALVAQVEAQQPLDAKVAASLQALRDVLETQDIEYITEDCFNSIDESLSGAVRVQEIVRDLKDFSRNDDDQRVRCDLNECIEGSIKLAWSSIKQNIEIVKNFAHLPLIYCCASQLTQVFINIMMNAAQAMEFKGTIEICTAVRGDDIAVEFIDSGPGIKKENLTKLFDPFFTTKDVGMGTGLGLYVSHGLIQKHRGTITATNEPGKGAKITVTLPIDMRENRDR